MITSLKPYPAMKDSGVEWLGEVPKHWEVRRLKAAARLIMGQSPASVDCSAEPIGVPFLQGCAEFGVDNPKPIQYCRAPSKVSPQEAILMSVRAPVGRLNVADQQYGIGRGLCAIIPDKNVFIPGFARYELAVIGHGLTIASTGSTYDAVGTGDVGIQPTILPSLPEQAAIVRYLDYMDPRVRRLVRAKRKLIALLTEQKQAIIHRAVTRGLNPDVPMKDSGVEWLGEVPEHWEVARLKDAAIIQTGITLGKNYKGLETNPYPYLRVANVQAGRLDLEVIKQVDVPLAEANGATLKWGDVLMTEGGDIDKLGRGCIWRNEIPGCLHQNHIFAVRCRSDLLNPEFLVGLMTSQHGRLYFQMTAKQTTNLASTNGTTLRGFPIVLPPLSEQKLILADISTRTASAQKALEETNREIDLLNEYRTRLIADVVTGKVDVHEAAAALPEVDPLATEIDADDTLDTDTEADIDDMEDISEEDEP